MKRFIFEIKIDEGSDEFWEAAESDLPQAISDLHTMITECLAGTGLDDAQLRLVRYTDEE